jgi:bacteriocin-like protein
MKKYLRQLNKKKNIYVQDIQKKELSDEELSLVVGGLNSQPLPPEQGSNGSTNLISSKQLNKAGYAIGG